MFVNGQKVRKPFTNFSPVFDQYLRTHLRTFTNFAFRLRTLGFIYELACFVYELACFIYELACFVYELACFIYEPGVSFTNLHALFTNFPFCEFRGSLMSLGVP